MFYDPTYFCFMIPAFLLTMYAQWRVSSAYSKWGKTRNSLNITGLDAARRLLSASGSYASVSDSGGLSTVQLAGVGGTLTDNYDPSRNTLFLSQGVAQNPSVASIAVAAHEIGHASQQAEGYGPLRLRSLLVPAVSIGSYLGWIMIIGGFFLASIEPALGSMVSWLGVLLFSLGAVFALCTLPVELNASNRARAMLAANGMLVSEEDTRGVNEVLTAAALTYVAGLASAIMQVLYFASMVSGRRRS